MGPPSSSRRPPLVLPLRLVPRALVASQLPVLRPLPAATAPVLPPPPSPFLALSVTWLPSLLLPSSSRKRGGRTVDRAVAGSTSRALHCRIRRVPDSRGCRL